VKPGVRIAICDDHRLFVDALAMVLRGRGWEVACADEPGDAVSIVRDTDVDVCLMDLLFPDGMLGLDGISQVRTASPRTQVVVLTALSDATILAKAVASGAAGIAFKDDDIDQIVEVVECVCDGEAVSRRPTPRSSARTESRSDAAGLGYFLTPRERETLERLAHGETGGQLATNMAISSSTARTHVQNVLTKLGVHSRLEAVAFAVSNNLIRVSHYGDPTIRPTAVEPNRTERSRSLGHEDCLQIERTPYAIWRRR
jgi:DNA-binding NarL/FixJ family response regulator